MCSETRPYESRRKDQQLGRTRQRERRGSTGRAGRLKVGTRLAIRLRMDGLLLCRSIGHCGHQPHRYGDMLVYIVTEAGDVNPSIMNWLMCNQRALRACFENHAGRFAKRRTMSRIMASCNSVSLVWTLRS